ncbi:MAG: GAF domain-containing protein [Jatrophihabitans sp.]
MSTSRRTAPVEVVERFHAALEPMLIEAVAPSLLPSMLARAAASALGADGAGISVLSDRYRVPIGSSSATAARAERLQFTVGDGPCLDAVAQLQPQRVDEDQMRGEWPEFHDELCRHTPYRSIVALPIIVAEGVRGAMDIYLVSTTMPAYRTVTDAVAIGAAVSEMLGQVAESGSMTARWSAGEIPDWLYGEQSRHRLRLWIAVGVLMAQLDLDSPAALDRLRAHAFATDFDIDMLADGLIDGTLTARDLEFG